MRARCPVAVLKGSRYGGGAQSGDRLYAIKMKPPTRDFPHPSVGLQHVAQEHVESGNVDIGKIDHYDYGGSRGEVDIDGSMSYWYPETGKWSYAVAGSIWPWKTKVSTVAEH